MSLSNDCLPAAIPKLTNGMCSSDDFMNFVLECGLSVRDLFADNQICPDALNQFLTAMCVRCHLFVYTYGRYNTITNSPTITPSYCRIGDEISPGQYLPNFLVLVNSETNGNIGAGHYYCIDGDRLSDFRADNAVQLLKSEGSFASIAL